MSTIEIQLCKEDRARLDKIIEGLDQLKPNCHHCVATATEVMNDMAKSLSGKAEQEPTETPTTPQDETEAETQEVVNPAEENGTTEVTEDDTAPEEVATKDTEEVATKVTLEQIQSKVLQLASANNGAKKAQVRAVISVYGAKVSDLKEQPDKWDEVWAKLSALEREV